MANLYLTGSDTINVKMSDPVLEPGSIDIEVDIEETSKKLVQEKLVKSKDDISAGTSTLISFGEGAPNNSTPGKIYIQI